MKLRTVLIFEERCFTWSPVTMKPELLKMKLTNVMIIEERCFTWSPVTEPVYSARSPSICLGSCRNVTISSMLMRYCCQQSVDIDSNHNCQDVLLNVLFDWNLPCSHDSKWAMGILLVETVHLHYHIHHHHTIIQLGNQFDHLYITCRVNEGGLDKRQSASTAVMEATATTRLHIAFVRINCSTT